MNVVQLKTGLKSLQSTILQKKNQHFLTLNEFIILTYMIQSYVLGTFGLSFRSFRYFEGTGHENEGHTMQVYILKFEI